MPLLAATVALVALTGQQQLHISARLASEVASVRPGGQFVVALVLSIQDGWHTYWRNPGDMGSAPTIDWQLPEGWKAGPIEWPVPRRIELGDGMVSYGYEGQAVLLTRLTPPNSVHTAGSSTLVAKIAWVVCNADACVAEGADCTLTCLLATRREIPSTGRW